MSKLICSSAIAGAAAWVARASEKLEAAISEKGADHPAAFPFTTYHLPVIYSFTGLPVRTLGDLRQALKLAGELLPTPPGEEVWLPYLGPALDAGVAALFACEIIEACKYAAGPDPVGGIWLGAASDVIMRERGIEFVDGSAPGFAAVTGAAPDAATAVRIARELQEKNLYVFMAGCSGGVQFAEQLAGEGVQLGWETRLVPFGRDVSALIYALGFANRAALSFGGVKPGDYAGNLRYNKNRIFAFVLALGEVTPEKYAVAAGAINYGFPVIADTDIPEILPTGVCTYEHVVANVPHEAMVERALEIRGCKILVTKVPVPVPYGPAFEGERIRKEDTRVEFGGQKTPAFEFVTMVEPDQITDGEIEIIGPDVDTAEVGAALPLGIWVEAAGRKMQTDFEPILERQIHHVLNAAEGIWHMGQRDIVWTRISKAGFEKGLRLKHYGEIIHARFLADYPAIVDKVKVTLITDREEVERRLAAARRVYDERNRRLESMTDDSVEEFYSCLLCQSFAPDHVCIITPERLGLCGAYNWLDGKAAHEIDETGPNQPVKKGECLDPRRGIWQGVNDYVYPNSHKSVRQFSAYSIMDTPMTSCGCFEVICAVLPECNGVMAVNREFQGDTPVGMTFSSLAGSVGGGQQTPGFMGCGKVFLTSRKFLAYEGGFRRLVWMPRELKEMLKADLELRFREQEVPGLLEQIADETKATAAAEVRKFLEEAGHPALEMEDIFNFAAGADEAAGPPEAGAKVERPPEPPPGPEPTSLRARLEAELKSAVDPEAAARILGLLDSALAGAGPAERVAAAPTPEPEAGGQAAEAVGRLSTVPVRRESSLNSIWTVKLGAARDEGGTRGRTYTIGGETCMPFHLWEGEMPHRPLVAIEVFDAVSGKYPPPLREIYGGLIEDPAAMAKAAVERYGADLISVRLDATHPERGDRSPEEALETVKSVLAAVDVPLIVTGHNSFEKNNEVMKAVARGCAGENLLLNWVEQDNYKTIAGAAVAYGHSLVAQSPIDVNIAKQLNILLTNMDVPPERIVMDPMTGAAGYGIEYTYSVMERIRLTALDGDRMLLGPMLVTPGQECVKIKECRAEEKDFPAWGDLGRRAALWEYATALSLLQAGADLLIMYHPEAAAALRKAIDGLMDRT